uniref:Uncharacterized protein n=1 Tax=Siphoviridae sp. ctVCm11 TaxID=2826358 RepID=A0A8S5QM13_9CAUD|nr:MAG TPA: hypothetical protein [Siphoviridae sp. ctVCm11]DAU34954.1 MAG TPA: hypothetical protein [Caudoviricetes sp.]
MNPNFICNFICNSSAKPLFWWKITCKYRK